MKQLPGSNNKVNNLKIPGLNDEDMDFSTFKPRLFISSSAKKIKSTIRFATFRNPITKKKTTKKIHYESITYKAIVNGVDHYAFVLKSIKEIYKYESLGAQRCLYLLNKKEYGDLCDTINDIKVSIVKIYKDDNDEQSIEILKNKNKHNERIRSSFNKWFEKNGYTIPDTQGLDTYYQICHDKIIHYKKNNTEEDLPVEDEKRPKPKIVTEPESNQTEENLTKKEQDNSLENEDRVARLKVKELKLTNRKLKEKNRALQRFRSLKHDLNEELLKEFIEKSKHPNTGKFKFRRLAILIGCDHKTAKRIVERHNLMYLTGIND